MGRPARPRTPDQPSFGALAESMALGMAYQMLASPDGVTRRFVYVSESCAQLNGVPAAAAIADARALYDLISPEDQARMAQAELEAAASKTSFDIEVRFRRPDGEVRWNRIASAPRTTPWPDGSILWDGIQIDVTEKKRIELELAEQRRRLDLATEATGLGFWEWNLRERTLAWSERNREIFGLGPDAALSIERYLEALHPDDVELVRQAYAAARDIPDGDFSMEYRVVTPEGAVRWILAHARVIHDAEGPAMVVGSSLDVTERRSAEERRTLLMQELAHRAKNGLAMVMAIASQSARGAATVEQYSERLIDRLQALAQSQDLVTASGGRPVRLGELMARVLEPFDRPRVTLDEGLQEVRLNGETGFAIALLTHELATNATKYGALSAAEGRVRVRLVSTADGLARVEWRESGGPPVAAAPGRRGFGSRLMEMALRPRGGKVEPVYAPAGLVAVLDVPTEVAAP